MLQFLLDKGKRKASLVVEFAGELCELKLPLKIVGNHDV